VSELMLKKNRERFIQKFTESKLGLERKRVRLVPYEQKWEEAASWVMGELLAAVTSIELIEPIGSTSIPGAIAKPILDIQIVLPSRAEILKQIPHIEELGFVYKGDGIARVQKIEPDPDRHFFAYYDESQEVDYAHLHVVLAGSPETRAKLEFRDRLRQNPALVQAYNDLKLQLQDSGVERHAYTNLKSDFVNSVLAAS
jgi:GrpB-like predicted nucleotidyltransferase (UPF0157 family)